MQQINEMMELAFYVQKIAIFTLMLPGVTGLILGNTTATSCDGSTANINFLVDQQTDIIPQGSEIWFFESTIIATKPNGVFTPQGNYASRLHSYLTYGLTLDNITAADGGIYLLVFSYYSPIPQGTKTATATLIVNVAPTDNCIPSYRQSGHLATCELDKTANCGSPRLEPMWINTHGNTLTVTNSGIYTCCANGSVLMNCYRGSSILCVTFQMRVAVASTPGNSDDNKTANIVGGVVGGVAVLAVVVAVGKIIHNRCKKKEHIYRKSDESRRDAKIQMEEKGVKSNVERKETLYI